MGINKRFMKAVKANDVSTVRSLLESKRGKHIDVVADALEDATKHNHTRMVLLLIPYLGEEDYLEIDDAIYTSAVNGNVVTTKALINTELGSIESLLRATIKVISKGDVKMFMILFEELLKHESIESPIDSYEKKHDLDRLVVRSIKSGESRITRILLDELLKVNGVYLLSNFSLGSFLGQAFIYDQLEIAKSIIDRCVMDDKIVYRALVMRDVQLSVDMMHLLINNFDLNMVTVDILFNMAVGSEPREYGTGEPRKNGTGEPSHRHAKIKIYLRANRPSYLVFAIVLLMIIPMTCSEYTTIDL